MDSRDGKRSEERAYFAFSDSFDPNGSTVAKVYHVEGRPWLCLKSDYLELVSETAYRRAFKRCVELVRQ